MQSHRGRKKGKASMGELGDRARGERVLTRGWGSAPRPCRLSWPSDAICCTCAPAGRALSYLQVLPDLTLGPSSAMVSPGDTDCPVTLPCCPASSTGDYFGILKEARVTTFPFNIVDNPMYWGSTANYLGWAVL